MQKVITVTEKEMSEAVFRYVGERLGLTGDVKGVVRFDCHRVFMGKGKFSATVTIGDD